MRNGLRLNTIVKLFGYMSMEINCPAKQRIIQTKAEIANLFQRIFVAEVMIDLNFFLWRNRTVNHNANMAPMKMKSSMINKIFALMCMMVGFNAFVSTFGSVALMYPFEIALRKRMVIGSCPMMA